MLCDSVVKLPEKHSPQRHGAYTENHGGLFPTDSFAGSTHFKLDPRTKVLGYFQTSAARTKIS